MLVTDARLLGALTLRSRVELKRQLQLLYRAHAATCAFLFTATAHGATASRVEFAGDPGALPSSRDLGGTSTFVCEQRTLRCADGEEREVVLLYTRLCTAAPVLILGLVDSRAAFTDVLTEDIEATADKVECILVDALEPPPAQQPAGARSGGRR